MKYKLKDIGRVITGCTPKTKNKEYYKSSDYLFIGPSDLKNGKYIIKTEKYISDEAYKDYFSRFIANNSIMVDCIGSDMGNVAITLNEVLTNQQINSITDIDEKRFNIEYIYYVLSTMKNYFHQIGTNGSTMPIINKTMFEEIQIEIPEKNIQDKIVNILSRIDRKIELNNQINDNLLNIGIELVKNDFNKLDTEKLSSIIKFVKGKKPNDIINYRKAQYEKYLTIACLNGQELNYGYKTKMIMSNNDLLMVMDGASSGEVYYGGYGIVGSTLARIDCFNNQYISEFIYFTMKYYKELIQSKNTGSAIPHADKTFISSLEIPKISLKNQEKYKVLLIKIKQNIEVNETLTELRDTLIPKLINGKIDLSEIRI